jgi:hypothetical protein
MICGDMLGINIHPNLVAIHLHKKFKKLGIWEHQCWRSVICVVKNLVHIGAI